MIVSISGVIHEVVDAASQRVPVLGLTEVLFCITVKKIHLDNFMQKKILLSVLAVALLIGGAVLVWQKKSQVIPKEATKEMTIADTPPSDTADWKTYRNEEYGFEVKYPKSLEARNWGSSGVTLASQNPPLSNPQGLDLLLQEIWFDIGPENFAYWDAFQGKAVKDIEDFDFLYPEDRKYLELGSMEVSFQRKDVNNSNVMVVSSVLKEAPVSYMGGGWIEGGWDKEAFFQCKNRICSIAIHSHSYSEVKEQLFEKVLDTLKVSE